MLLCEGRRGPFRRRAELHALVLVLILQLYDRFPGSKSVFVSCCNVQPMAPHDLRPNDEQTKFRVYDVRLNRNRYQKPLILVIQQYHHRKERLIAMQAEHSTTVCIGSQANRRLFKGAHCRESSYRHVRVESKKKPRQEFWIN